MAVGRRRHRLGGRERLLRRRRAGRAGGGAGGRLARLRMRLRPHLRHLQAHRPRARRRGAGGRRARSTSAGSRYTDRDGGPDDAPLLQRRERRPHRRGRRAGEPVGQAARRDRRLRLGGDRDVLRATATAASACGIDERELDQVSNNVIVGNCRYFAGGMKILPMAEPDDGLLDVLVWGDVGKARPGAEPAQALPGHARRTTPRPTSAAPCAWSVEPESAAADRGRRRDSPASRR